MKKRFVKTKGLIKFIVFLSLILGVGFIYLNMRYPIGYNSMIKKYSIEYDIDPYLIASIINVESSYNKEAVSPKDARGLMQISSQTGIWASEQLSIENYSEESLFDPETNIMIGSWYLDKLKSEFDGDLDKMLISYNAGSGNLNKWLANEEYSQDGINVSKIPFQETEKYLVKVKKSYKIYSTVYKKYFNEIDEDSVYIDLGNNVRRKLKILANKIENYKK